MKTHPEITEELTRTLPIPPNPYEWGTEQYHPSREERRRAEKLARRKGRRQERREKRAAKGKKEK